MNISKSIRTKEYWLIGLVVVSLTLFFALRVNIQHGSDNDMSRLAGVIAVARYRELPIDQTVQKITLDRIEYKDHKYSSKPPVLHVALGESINKVFQIKKAWLSNDIAIYRFSTFLVTVIPLIGIFALFYYLIRKREGVALSLTYSLFLIFGTLLFSYSRYLTNHTLEALLQLCLFALLLIDIKHPRLRAMLIGFLLSAIFVVDITYGFVVIPVTVVYLFFVERKFVLSNWYYAVLAGLPLVILHFYLSYVQFETLLPPQLFPEKYLSYYGSKWVGEVTGMEAQNHNMLVRLFNYSFGTYGFFFYQPILLIPFFVKKNWRNPLWIYVVVISVSYILFNTIMQPNYGGSSFGPRRFLPLIPMIFYFAAVHLNSLWNNSKKWRISIAFAFVWTVFSSLLGYINTWGNWDYFMNIDDTRDFYFPMLYTIRKILRWFGLAHLLNFTYSL